MWADHLIGALAQVLIVGNDVIDPEHIVFGEHDARIDHDDLAFVFVRRHVLSDFPETTQGNNLQFSMLTHFDLSVSSLSSNMDFPANGG